MKATVKRADLFRVLGLIKPFVASKTLAYRAIWLSAEKNRLTLEILNEKNVGISCHIPAEVEDAAPGAAGLDFRLLFKMLRYAPEKFTFEFSPASGNSVKMSFFGGSLSCVCVEPTWKQELPSWYGTGHVVSTTSLADALDRVWRGASTDNFADALTCVRLCFREGEGLLAEALNGHQYLNALVPDFLASQAGWQALLPADGILLRSRHAGPLVPFLRSGLLGKSVTAHVEKQDKVFGSAKKNVPARLFLCGGRCVMSLPLESFDYPATESFVKAGRNAPGSLSASAGEILSALRMLAEMTDDINRCVHITPSPAGALLSVKNGDLGGDFLLAAEVRGAPQRIAFPAASLLSMVRAYNKDETILFRMTSAEGPCLITGDQHPGQETILMPMKTVDLWPFEAEAAA